MVPKTIKIILASIFAVFSLWIIIAPFTAEAGFLLKLDGTVGTIDHADIWKNLNPFAAAIYYFGDFVCHQEEARSFILNGNELPVCSREACIYVSMAIGFLIVLFADLKKSRNGLIYIIVSFALIVADWAIERIFSLNVFPARIITGILAGIAIAMTISFILDSMFLPSDKGNLFK